MIKLRCSDDVKPVQGTSDASAGPAAAPAQSTPSQNTPSQSTPSQPQTIIQPFASSVSLPPIQC